MEQSPVRIVGEVLRALREQAGLTQQELAANAYCSQPLISGLERGTKTARPELIAQIDEVLSAKGLLIKIWPVTTSGEQSAESLADLEAKATAIHDWEERVVPGLLQTVEYAGAVIRAARPWASESEIEDAIKTRIDRQRIFTKPSPPIGWFVVDESVLHRPFGGREVMREQLIHLEDVANQPNMVIQVIQFSSVEHPGSAGPLRIMEFSDNSPIWYTEGWSSGRMTDSRDEVASAMANFNLIRASALPPGGSVRFIREIRDSNYE
jgi:transcriptional regulator with XRE-family HTH domain